MKKLNIILVAILLIGVVGAGLSAWNKEINLTELQITQIKESGNVSEIIVSTSAIMCDEEYCYVDKIYQKDVIQTNWRGRKDYCSLWSQEPKGNETEGFKPECLGWTNYNGKELQQQVSDYIERKLGTWADAEMEREKVKIEVAGEGSIGVI